MLFGKKTFVINGAGGGPVTGGNDGLLIQDASFKFTIGATETNATLTHSEAYNINLSQAETNAAIIEATRLSLSGFSDANASLSESTQVAISGLNDINATLSEATRLSISGISETNAAILEANKLTLSGFSDVNGSLSESTTFKQRYWASASSDNDASRTTPTNANGQNDSTFAIVKTNNALGDLTNPVILTSTTFGTPASGSFAAKRIRAFFNIPARATTADTPLIIQYKLGAAAPVTIFTHSGTTALDHLAGTFTSDISGLTLAQVQTISLLASYTSAVVAVPETSIRVDAWCVELES